MFAKYCTLLGLVFLVGCGGVKVVPKPDPVEVTIPGKYTYFVAEGKTPAAFNAIPAKYHAGAMDRTFDVKEAGSIELKLD